GDHPRRLLPRQRAVGRGRRWRRDRLLFRLRRRAPLRRGHRRERLVREPGCDARPRARARLHRGLLDATPAGIVRARAVARHAAARGAAHLAGTPGLQLFPARLAHDDPEGPRVLAAVARAPHRAREGARRHARLMDATMKVTEVPASRGATWLVESFSLFRRAPAVWIGLCAGWIVITLGLMIVPIV